MLGVASNIAIVVFSKINDDDNDDNDDNDWLLDDDDDNDEDDILGANSILISHSKNVVETQSLFLDGRRPSAAICDYRQYSLVGRK